MRWPLFFIALITTAVSAQELVIGSGVTGCPGVDSYVQQAVHLDQGVIVGPVNNPGFQATGSWTTSNNAIPVASTPSGCLPGELVYELTQQIGFARIGYVAANGCGATSITLAANALHAGGSGDYLMLSGPIAAADSCQFTFSGWLRVAPLPSSYETIYNDDVFSGGQTAPGGYSSEQEMGIDMVVDNNGFRRNIADYTGTHNFSAYVNTNNASIASKLIGGQWNHILWTVNACTSTIKETTYIDGAQLDSYSQANTLSIYGIPQSATASGSWAAGATTITLGGSYCPTGITNWSVTDSTYSPAVFVGRVSSCSSGRITLSAGALYPSSASGTGTSDSLQFNGGVNFADMAGGFWLNMPSNGDTFNSVDWADVALWAGVDLICSHTPYNGTCPLGSGTTISASDLAMFGENVNGVWTPVSLSTALSTLGGGNNGVNGLLAYYTTRRPLRPIRPLRRAPPQSALWHSMGAAAPRSIPRKR
jgi:hypothetical protein